MNILHINSHDLHGARFNGYDMQRIIDGENHIEMAVWEKSSSNANVYLIPPSYKVLKFLTNLLIAITSKLGLDRLLGYSGFFLDYKNYFKKADILHLHLLHNYTNVSILSLPELSRKKPTIWTLHDPWAFTGGCEHSFDCGKWMTGCNAPCPHPRSNSLLKKYTPFFHWKIKKNIYSKSDLTLIVASEWMRNRVRLSPLLSHLPCYLIPFGVDINLFKKGDKLKARHVLGIKPNDNVIAFRDPGLTVDKFKGMKWLKEALLMLKIDSPTTLLIFQDGSAFDMLDEKYDIVKTGWINEESMALAFTAADVFVMPSIQESFGLMAVEAMACSLPVVVFEGTALPSVIKAPIGGLAVPAKNSKALCDSIELLLLDKDLRLKIGTQGRKLVETEYSDKEYRQKHMEVYKAVIDEYQQRIKKVKNGE